MWFGIVSIKTSCRDIEKQDLSMSFWLCKMAYLDFIKFALLEMSTDTQDITYTVKVLSKTPLCLCINSSFLCINSSFRLDFTNKFISIFQEKKHKLSSQDTLQSLFKYNYDICFSNQAAYLGLTVKAARDMKLIRLFHTLSISFSSFWSFSLQTAVALMPSSTLFVTL